MNFAQKLSQLEKQDRYRSLSLPCGIDLTSNDYLGMAFHPALRQCAIDALQSGIDIGAGGSRLLRGHTQHHAELEKYAAKHFNAPAALYFGSGFMANYALLTTLPARKDLILYDALIHASMRDGIKATNAKSYKFAHNDLSRLEDLLKQYHQSVDKIWITIESVYSMDGDCAPVCEIYDLAEQYNAYLLIDEAHATGVLGTQGKGLAHDIIKKQGHDRIITIHTCGKAIGVAGGLICASKDIISYLVNAARPFIYATATPPIQSIIVKKSLEIIASDEGNKRRKRLFKFSKQAKKRFGGAGTHIIPVMLYDDKKAVSVSNMLQKDGFDIRAIRPPTVPEGTARLRLSLGSELTEKDLNAFCECYNEIINEKTAT